MPRRAQARAGLPLSERDYCHRKRDQIKKQKNTRRHNRYERDTGTKRMEKFWHKYCNMMGIDPIQTLKDEDEDSFMGFLDWYCETHDDIKRTSSAVTYWRRISQIYINYLHQRMDPIVMVQMEEWIWDSLTDEWGLEWVEKDKPLLDVTDMMLVLHCHWVTDNNTFPTERHRIQMAAILTLAAYTGSRPTALLTIKYQDLELFVQPDEIRGEPTLVLLLCLKNVKLAKRKRIPKTYTFYNDTNPLLCVVSYFISLACDDNAFASRRSVTPNDILTLTVPEGRSSQEIRWKNEIQDTPVFHKPAQTTELKERLPYSRYHDWLKRLGDQTGFGEALTTYCIRRASGNAINDSPNCSESVRNLVMDHTSSEVFQRNYLSRMIRFDTQASYQGTAPRMELLQASNRMSRTIDPRRPKHLTYDQKQSVQQRPEIQQLHRNRIELSEQIRGTHKFVNRTVGTLIHTQYTDLQKEVNRAIIKGERELLKQIIREYDSVAATRDLDAQLAGEPIDALPPAKPIEYAFEQRARLAAALTDQTPRNTINGDIQRRISIINDMVSLCTMRERLYRDSPRAKRVQSSEILSETESFFDTESSSDAESSTYSSSTESDSSNCEFPHRLKCHRFQCLYCLGTDDLPQPTQSHDMKTKYSLKRHIKRYHVFQPGQACPYRDPECTQAIFENELLFRNHAASVHGIEW